MSYIPMEPRQNNLLSALSDDVMDRLYPHLEFVALPMGEVLYESGDDRRNVYFPVDCIVSLMQDIENGSSAEISMVGNEGIVGINAFMGGDGSPWRAVVQTAGFAYRLPGKLLREEFDRHGEMLQLMMRYTQSRITQMSQAAVCNRHHSIDQQVCRWLLQSLDRLSSTTITMTQELLSHALGVRREGVTVAAGKLHKLGVIEYSRGKITVLDRNKLESLSCECYGVVRKETERLLPVMHQDEQSFVWTNKRLESGVGRARIKRTIDDLVVA
ncbi:MAG: Crp/Fnr family transcriptional regulator [Arenimonas sp.]